MDDILTGKLVRKWVALEVLRLDMWEVLTTWQCVEPLATEMCDEAWYYLPRLLRKLDERAHYGLIGELLQFELTLRDEEFIIYLRPVGVTLDECRLVKAWKSICPECYTAVNTDPDEEGLWDCPKCGSFWPIQKEV